MRKTTLGVFLCCLFFLAVSIGLAQEGKQGKDIDLSSILKNAKTEEEFHKATIAVADVRYQLIRKLIRMLRNNPDKHKKIRISYLLGEYRATEAKTDLSKEITLEEKVTDKRGELPRWRKYPVQEALIKIGNRAIPFMIRNLETSKDEKVRERSAQVIWLTLAGAFRGGTAIPGGKELALIVVKKAIETQSDAEKKKNLESALKYFK